MQKLNKGIVLAISCVLLGGFFVLRAIRSQRLSQPQQIHVEVAEAVASALNSAHLDTNVVPENLQSVEADLRRRLGELLSNHPTLFRLSELQRRDLIDAFVDRWLALVDPVVNRDHDSLAARGDPRSLDETMKLYDQYRSWMESLKFPSVGMKGLVIRDVADPSRFSENSLGDFGGFSRQMSVRDKPRLPIPSDPAGSGWTVVEITMPFEKSPMHGEGFGVVLLGFQFGWSTDRRQWIPYAAVMYKAPGEPHAAIPFR